VGPGEYKTEEADNQTKTRVPTVLINPSSTPTAPQISAIGPGTYSEPHNFGDSAQTFTIA